MMKVILTYVFDRKKVASKVKAGVVELKISSNGKRKYISTGMKLFPKQWSNGSVVGREDWKELNDQLQNIKKKCSEIINQMIEDGTLDIDAVPRRLTESIMQRQTFIEYARDMNINIEDIYRQLDYLTDRTKPRKIGFGVNEG